MEKFITILLILFSALLINNCATVDLNGLDPDNFQNADTGGDSGSGGTNLFEDVDCNNVDSTFSTQVKPIFDASCATTGCHTGSNPAGDVQLDAQNTESLSTIGSVVTSGPGFNGINVHQSLILLTALASDAGGEADDHTGGAVFSSVDDDLEKIYCWLEDGRENDQDNAFNFGDDVVPLFDDCDACHDGTPAPDLRINNNTIRELYDNIDGGGYVTANDANSLIYTQPTDSDGMDAHGGGERFAPASAEADIILNWINNGAPFD